MNHGYSLETFSSTKYTRRVTMAQANDSEIISVVHPICCGLDVHQKSISACLISTSVGGDQIQIRTFQTFTDDLIRMRDWLIQNDCPIVAIESTGVYWRPVHNILEGHLMVVLVNARHFKNVPGRKTDTKDSKWLAGLLRYGLLKGSFIPPKQVRQWRDLARWRKQYVQSVADYKRRVHKLFETANIKIDSVVSDLFGVTGRNLMALLLVEPSQISSDQVQQAARGKLRDKTEDLLRAVDGYFEDHHRFLLSLLLQTIDALEQKIHSMDNRLKALMTDHAALLERMDQVPGVNDVAASAILAEIGTDLEAFHNPAALCSWAGLSPGNNESAGKRHSGKSPVRKHHLKTLMIEVAWAAIKTKKSFYQAKYYALKARRGAKKAIVGIAHRLLKAIYHIIKNGAVFKDLGADYMTQAHRTRKIHRLNKQASQLGYQLVPCHN
jgi:transposase